MTESAEAGNVELELKLALPRDRHGAVGELPMFRDTPSQQLHEVTTYYDTPDFDLRREGTALRIRKRGDRLIQTLKTRGGDEVASNRGEWEWDVGSDVPDLGRLGETPRAELAQQLDGRLRPVFRTDIARTVHMLDGAGGARIEAALDRGQIIAGDASEPVSELELELKSGSDPAALYHMALDIHARVPLALAGESKAARGYRLLDGREPTARKAPKIRLAPDITVADGFRRITGSALSHLVANARLAERGDPEGIHQVRVALRRLRAALLLFKRHLDRAECKYFGDALRKLGRVLGAARDWDVFVLETMADARGEHRDESWPGELDAAASALRLQAHRDAAVALEGPGLTNMVLSLAAWVEDGVRDPSLLGSKTVRKDLCQIAPKMLDRVDKKARQLGANIEALEEEELHALRKALKKLRYDAEFLEGLYPHDAVKEYRKHCEYLQEILGRFNDARVTIDLAGKLGKRHGDGLTGAVDAARAWSEARRDSVLGQLGPAWQDFQAASPFWA
ncbi:MAG: CHAD domain-containing protein [Acetobacteraceae bacterium]|nr:CHAD domain-containing protein [Acetobacteraceae bacterium]